MADGTKQQQRTKVSLVFLPFPAISHLVATVELAKAILLHHNRDPSRQFFVDILNIPPIAPSPEMSSYISSATADSSEEGIRIHEFPKLDPPLVPNASPLPILMDFHKPHVRSTIQDILLSTPVAAVIVDHLYFGMIDIVKELGLPCYPFFTTSATILGYMLYVPTLDALLPAEKDMEELQDEGATIHFPGFSSPMPPMVVPYPFLHRKERKHVPFMHLTKRYIDVEGFIVNSYLELQPYLFQALEEGSYLPDHPMPPVYSAGPLLSLNSKAQKENGCQQHECLRWLDAQPAGSVVFLCFGSMGALSKKQATEVAVGLERSGHRFLWVLRSPRPQHLKIIPGSITDADLDEVLPEGFLERTKHRGMVWPKFAPQTAILGHTAVGAFVTHCGWNSVLESLWFGVPMLAWPLQFEQHLNAFEMFAEMGIAVELEIDRKKENWATAAAIEKGVRCLMETDSTELSRNVRSKAAEVSEKGRRALMEGGSSFCSLQKLTRKFLSDMPLNS